MAFAAGLQELGTTLIATGGTREALVQAGLAVTPVEAITGFPEILDGRVKTLHPVIHAGILAQPDNIDHQAQLSALGIEPIDIVVCNLYPFEETARRPGATQAHVVDQIDIGGPAMIRAAAKNFTAVLVLTDPGDYSAALNVLSSGAVTVSFRQGHAVKAFAHVSFYDATIAAYLEGNQTLLELPPILLLAARRERTLRYGENPHQRAAVYRPTSIGSSAPSLLDVVQISGKELSYNNLFDADIAWRAASAFAEPTAAIVKHMAPCGLASRPRLVDAYLAAFDGDPVSAFGGIAALNRTVDQKTAQAMVGEFFEVIVTPRFTASARQILERKRYLRLLEIPNYPGHETSAEPLEFRQVTGGLLIQTPDNVQENDSTWTVMTKRAPTEREWDDLRFAWRVVRLVRSNAIVIARDAAVLGIGGGQPNRLDSVGLAVNRAGARAHGAVLASDAFFPFADGVVVATDAGISAIVQPGGSLRDAEVVAAADDAGIAMLATGIRHFRH